MLKMMCVGWLKADETSSRSEGREKMMIECEVYVLLQGGQLDVLYTVLKELVVCVV
jgi:hypothetical protein